MPVLKFFLLKIKLKYFLVAKNTHFPDLTRIVIQCKIINIIGADLLSPRNTKEGKYFRNIPTEYSYSVRALISFLSCLSLSPDQTTLGEQEWLILATVGYRPALPPLLPTEIVKIFNVKQ